MECIKHTSGDSRLQCCTRADCLQYSTRLIPEEPQSRIAWIGSMIVFLLLFSGVFIGPLLDAGYLHYILGLGTFLMCFGFMMTSLCDEFYQLFLAQGIVVGLAAGMLVLPAMTIPVSWYPSAGGRALVFSTVGTAASIGGESFYCLRTFHFRIVVASYLMQRKHTLSLLCLNDTNQCKYRHRIFGYGE